MSANGVSVICTVRDEERHVREALSSALADLVTEVVVVDDGSTDATADVLQRIAAEDRRVRVVTLSAVGRGVALRTAMREVRGDLIVNIDADDAIHPDWIRLGTALLASHPSLAVVAASPQYITGDETARWPHIECGPMIRDVTSHLAFYNPIVHSSAVMRRPLVEAVGGYEATRRFQFDYDLWIRLARAGWRLGVVNVPMVAKRLHDGQKFERGHRVAYLLSSVITQAQAIRTVGGGTLAWATIGGRLLWGVVPRPIRMLVRRSLIGRLRAPRRQPARRQRGAELVSMGRAGVASASKRLIQR
jgi:glycosyltransferase involved in cell wall biosynthesis